MNTRGLTLEMTLWCTDLFIALIALSIMVTSVQDMDSSVLVMYLEFDVFQSLSLHTS